MPRTHTVYMAELSEAMFPVPNEREVNEIATMRLEVIDAF